MAGFYHRDGRIFGILRRSLYRMNDSSDRTDQIVEFLKRRQPNAFCDDCTAAHLEPPANRHYVAAITKTLGRTEQYDRSKGQCWGPRGEAGKMVIRML